MSVTVGEDEALEAAVEGSELGLLVGQKGVTLQAVQELVRSMVQRRFVGQSHARVRLDVAGYRGPSQGGAGALRPRAWPRG